MNGFSLIAQGSKTLQGSQARKCCPALKGPEAAILSFLEASGSARVSAYLTFITWVFSLQILASPVQHCTPGSMFFVLSYVPKGIGQPVPLGVCRPPPRANYQKSILEAGLDPQLV